MNARAACLAPALIFSAIAWRRFARQIALALVGVLALTQVCAATEPQAVRIAIGAAPGVAQSVGRLRGNILFTRIIQESWLEAQLKQRGIALEWVPITGELGPVTNEAFAAKRIDFAQIGDLPSIILNARGVRTQMIVGNGKGSDLYLVVPQQSTAKSIRDLKGKRVSVQLARPWELGFRKLAQANGLQWSDFKTFNLNPQVSVSALSSGKIDAYFGISGPLFEYKGIGRIIWSTKGHFEDKVRSGELWGAHEFIQRYPDITQIVATAYVRALYWRAQDENRDAVIHESVLDGTPESVVLANLDDKAVRWRDHASPLIDNLMTEHYREATRFAFDTGVISKQLDPDEFFNTKFLETALAELKLQSYWSPSTFKRK